MEGEGEGVKTVEKRETADKRKRSEMKIKVNHI